MNNLQIYEIIGGSGSGSGSDSGSGSGRSSNNNIIIIVIIVIIIVAILVAILFAIQATKSATKSNTISTITSNTVFNTTSNTVPNTTSNTVSNTTSNTVPNTTSNTVPNTTSNTVSNTILTNAQAQAIVQVVIEKYIKDVELYDKRDNSHLLTQDFVQFCTQIVIQASAKGITKDMMQDSVKGITKDISEDIISFIVKFTIGGFTINYMKIYTQAISEGITQANANTTALASAKVITQAAIDAFISDIVKGIPLFTAMDNAEKAAENVLAQPLLKS